MNNKDGSWYNILNNGVRRVQHIPQHIAQWAVGTAPEGRRTGIQTLPRDVIPTIFKKLSQRELLLTISVVSKQWKDLVSQVIVSEGLELDDKGKKIDFENMRRIITAYSPNIIHIRHYAYAFEMTQFLNLSEEIQRKI